MKHLGDLSKFLEVSKLKKLPKMMSVQNPYNLLCRTYEIGLAEISIREKSGLLALLTSCWWIFNRKIQK